MNNDKPKIYSKDKPCNFVCDALYSIYCVHLCDRNRYKEQLSKEVKNLGKKLIKYE